jgi:cathepsin A (carboxypeptidase C)
MCNYLGNKAWMGNLESKFQDGFNKGKDHVWTTLEDGKKAGLVRAVGGGAGNYTYVQVFGRRLTLGQH